MCACVLYILYLSFQVVTDLNSVDIRVSLVGFTGEHSKCIYQILRFKTYYYYYYYCDSSSSRLLIASTLS